MDLINSKVVHKVFGEGIITNHENPYITVKFSQGDKKFKYPAAFDEHLIMKDSVIAEYINKAIKDFKAYEIEKNRLSECEREKIIQSIEGDKKAKVKGKTITRTNIAFKCNYCDGGTFQGTSWIYGNLQ